MQISDLLGHYMNAAGSQPEPITKKKGVEKLVSSMSEMPKGNIFEGTVNSIKGKQVVLGLSNGQQIVARLDGRINLQPGQSMFFQVKSNDGNVVAIRPFIIDGAGANLTLLEALKSAGLPTSEDHLAMVNKMMEEHMPIDRNSLNEMARLMQNNSEIDVTTLVQLKKLGLPVTIEFATQFENYLGDKQAINTALDEFMNSLPDMLANEELSSETLTQMGSDILSIVTEELPEEVEITENPAGKNINVIVAEEQLNSNTVQEEAERAGERNLLTENGEKITQEVNSQVQDIQKDQGKPEIQESAAEQKKMAEQEDTKIQERPAGQAKSGSIDLQKLQNLFPKEGFRFFENANMTEARANVPIFHNSILQTGELHQELGYTANTLGSILDEEQQQYLKGQLQVLFTEANQAYDSSKLDKNTSVVSVLKEIQELLSENPQMDKKVLLEFFSGNEFKSMVKDALEQQWTIRPKDLEGPDKINRLYEKLENQLTRMEEVVKATGQQENQVTHIADNIRDNVEFMKQINEAYTYVQIPLKMSGQNASGQLYVYTNKKNLKQRDEDLTAFLHLDMDNLGPTDVAVRLHGQEVTTNFYMENDASYELVKQFLPYLETKLKAKGYNCRLIVSNESKKVNFVEDFLKKDQPSAGRVRRYSFDMRA